VSSATNPDNPIEPKQFISRELKLRIVSAVVMAAIVLLITWIGGQTFTLLWAVIALLILREFNRICSKSLPFVQSMASFVALTLIISAWLIGDRVAAFSIFGVGFAVLVMWEMIVNRTAWSAMGLCYSALPFFAMSDMRADNFNGLIVILLLYFCVWGADVFAYFCGRAIGGPKLAPKISPNKTWAGFIGSLVGALFLSYLVDIAAGFEPILAFFIIILCAAVVSQLGDLMESSLKRKFDVKDSGTSIPGHGGVLDRVDGLVVAAVFVWLVSLYISLQQTGGNDLPTVFVNAFLMP